MQYESTKIGPRTQDLTGKTYERLTVLGFAGYCKKRPYFTCECACGTVKDIMAARLQSRDTRSCGCLKLEINREQCRILFTKHGKRYLPEYHIWRSMIDRCEVPTSTGYYKYGARDITICAAWHDFIIFYHDMGPRPTPHHSIERRDNDGPYSPENCFWATRLEQGRNKRNNHSLTYNGITQCIAAWVVETGIPSNIIVRRLQRGWSIEESLTIPPKLSNSIKRIKNK